MKRGVCAVAATFQPKPNKFTEAQQIQKSDRHNPNIVCFFFRPKSLSLAPTPSLGVFFCSFHAMDCRACDNTIVGVRESQSKALLWVFADGTTDQHCPRCLACPGLGDTAPTNSCKVIGVSRSKRRGKEFYLLQNSTGMWSSWIIPISHTCRR